MHYMLKASSRVTNLLSIGFCLINSQLTNIYNYLNSGKLPVSTRPDNHKLRSLSAEMFSKFKLQKLANFHYRRGSKCYEKEHPADIVSVPLLEGKVFEFRNILDQS